VGEAVQDHTVVHLDVLVHLAAQESQPPRSASTVWSRAATSSASITS